MDKINIALNTVKIGKKTSNPEIIILMGLPGSGKSLVANYLNEKYGYTILSGENISNALFENDKNADYVLVYKTLRQLALQLINNKHSIVVDGTNLRYAFRKQIYDEVCPNVDHLLIYLTIDRKTAIKRIMKRGEDRDDKKNVKSSCSDKTYKDFESQLEEPNADEPYRKIKSDSDLFSNIDRLLADY